MGKHSRSYLKSCRDSCWRHIKAFARAEFAAVTTLWLLLLPAVLLVGGFATDISMINAQKRYVQAQADLAATSAVTHLPDLQDSRDIAQEVVSLNRRYGAVDLGTSDVIFGAYTREAGFLPAADQSDPSGVNAVRVIVPSAYNPFLLRPVLTGDDYTIRRTATATQRAAISFSLRNSLLGVDTSESLLDPVLDGMLGLGASVTAIGYGGLANATVGVNDLLGLLTTRVSADALTFQEILDAEILTADLVDALLDLGGLPATVGSSSDSTLDLSALLRLSPQALDAEVGQILPDVGLNAFDLLVAAASVNGSVPGASLTDISLALPLAQLASAEADVSLIRPAVLAVGFINDVPPVSAELAQVDVGLQASLLSLLEVNVEVEGASAVATATSLNCGAGPGEALATFDVETSAASVNLSLTLLDPTLLDLGEHLSEIPIAATSQTITVRLDGAGNPEPVSFGTELALSDLTTTLSALLSDLKDSTEKERPTCTGLGCVLSPVLGALRDLVNGIVGQLNALFLDNVLLDQVAQTLLDALGIELAPAELIVSDYSCVGALVE